ncbi:SPOR domain-containing protein [Carboxylicivirga taeanensis]|uniref:SPOR domain-containing protein n=1 Tax=Carboxylicivirga taeanensis TaxID=1416875 RepID=UPI003F6E1C7B
MENYILSLIKENNRVIVPNFGAFIVAKENGLKVLFNNFLSFNDGLLVDFIVEKEAISKETAEQKINEYVEGVKDSLDTNGKYAIDGLGVFTKDATGILRFEQADELAEESEQAAPSAPSSNENDELLDIDNTDEEAPADEPGDVVVDLPETSVNKTTPIAEVVDDQPESEPTAEDSAEPETTINEEENSDPVAVANRYLEEDNSKRNRSIAIFLSAFILLPLIGFSIYFFLLKDNSPKTTQEKLNTEIKKVEPKNLTTSTDAGKIEAGPTDTPSEKQEKLVPVKEPEPIAAKTTKPHQLIVGSFGTEANANKMIEKLKAKGFNVAFCFPHNNRYLVSLESFSKVAEAQKRQEEILESDRMESWIMTKRQ